MNKKSALQAPLQNTSARGARAPTSSPHAQLVQQALAAFPRSDYAVALSSIDRALELQSDDTLTLNIRACVLGNLNRFHESLQTCDRALHIKPDYEDALINRGVGRLGKCD